MNADDIKRRGMLTQQLGAPAHHVNRFYVMEIDGGIRFTMMESLGKDSPSIPRNAFWMSTSNAEEFYGLLKKVLYGGDIEDPTPAASDQEQD